jgi:hypothetical protein
MAILVWDQTGERLYETGVDHGSYTFPMLAVRILMVLLGTVLQASLKHPLELSPMRNMLIILSI